MSAERQPPALIPTGDDSETIALIESWRYAGPPTPWDDVIGHAPQVLRCQELIEKLRRTPEELARLHIRLGAGLVISGPAGVGKSLLARALATAAERMVVVPPIAELDATLIHRLYAQLSKMPASVVILDEAEVLIGKSWLRTHDSDGLPALLAALDGVSRPRSGPITLALTTAEPSQLDPSAVRAGRLAPQLVLGEPSAAERRLLLERAVSGLPSVGQIDLQVLVDRTNGWTGAELVTAVEAACARSLLDRTDALRMDLLLEVIGEHYTVHDLRPATPEVLRAYALHEAGHALYAELTWPGLVESVSIDDRSGSTVLPEEVENSRPSLGHLRELAAMSLAGEAAERLVLGHAQTSVGGTTDRAKATSYLLSLLAIGRPFDPDALERGDNTDRGSERMRADLYAEVMREARAALTEAEVTLAAHRGAIAALAASLLAAPDRSLSGAALHEALQAALTQPGKPFHG